MTSLYAYAMGSFPTAGIELIADREGWMPVLSMDEIEGIIDACIDNEYDQELAADLREQMTPATLFEIWDAARLQNEEEFDAQEAHDEREAAAELEKIELSDICAVDLQSDTPLALLEKRELGKALDAAGGSSKPKQGRL